MPTKITAEFTFSMYSATTINEFNIAIYWDPLWEEVFYENYCSVKEREDRHQIFFKKLVLCLAEMIAGNHNLEGSINPKAVTPKLEKKQDPDTTIDERREGINLQWYIHRIGIEYQAKELCYHVLFMDDADQIFFLNVNERMMTRYGRQGIENFSGQSGSIEGGRICANTGVFEKVKFFFSETEKINSVPSVRNYVKTLKLKIEKSEENAFLNYKRFAFYPRIRFPVNHQVMNVPVVSEQALGEKIFEQLSISYSYKNFIDACNGFKKTRVAVEELNEEYREKASSVSLSSADFEQDYQRFISAASKFFILDGMVKSILKEKERDIKSLAEQRERISWVLQESIRMYFVEIREEFYKERQKKIEKLSEFFGSELIIENSVCRIKFVDLTGKDLRWLIHIYNHLVNPAAGLSAVVERISTSKSRKDRISRAREILKANMKEMFELNKSTMENYVKFDDNTSSLSEMPELENLVAMTNPDTIKSYYNESLRVIENSLNSREFKEYVNIEQNQSNNNTAQSALTIIEAKFANHKAALSHAEGRKLFIKGKPKRRRELASCSNGVITNGEASNSPMFKRLLTDINRILDEVSWWANQVRGCRGGDVVVAADAKKVPVPRGVATMKRMKDNALQANMSALEILLNYKKVAHQRLFGCNWPKFFHVRVDATTKRFYQLLDELELNHLSGHNNKAFTDFFNEKISALDPNTNPVVPRETLCDTDYENKPCYFSPSSGTSSSPSPSPTSSFRASPSSSPASGSSPSFSSRPSPSSSSSSSTSFNRGLHNNPR